MSVTKVTGFAHISLTVKDIARSCRLYQDLLGFVPCDEHVNENMRLLLLQNGGDTLELTQHTPAGDSHTIPGPVNHIALKVEGMEALIKELREHGYVFDDDAPNDAPEVFGGIRFIFFTGPDGERIELIENL